ncbi:neuronal acetylcholine receptor subunit alpha-10-like [Haliotis cracherodii]|uniref:neuronal acetylcholine receptor subunit alpha-10-like n=1 Tax=Haliotis cracherodii TaxID=6455 RepID=UPI0039ED7D98
MRELMPGSGRALVSVCAQVWVLTGVFVFHPVAAVTGKLPDEQRLLRRLFNPRVYDTSVRPVFNSSANVEVFFNFNLIQIMDMDEKNQILTLNAWLESNWKDERIDWDPEDFGGLKMFRLPSKKLWLPDIVLYNNADDYTTGFMPCNAMVDSKGGVLWSPPARLRSSCKIDIRYFPFDSQRCTLKFGSWTYDKAQVDLINRSELADISNYITNGEWRLTTYQVVRHEVVYPIGDAVYPDVTITLVIHRRILYYVLNILFPCFWLNILSVLTFCLPPDAGEKITLSITVLLSYSVFMLLVADSMPPTSDYVPLIEIYLTMSMAVASVSVILTVFILKLHHCPPNQAEVPNWVRYLVLKLLASIVRCSCVTNPNVDQSRPFIVVTPTKDTEPSDACSRLLGDHCLVPKSNHPQEMGSRSDDNLSVEFRSSTRRSFSNKDSSSDVRMHLYERSGTGMEELLRYLKLIVEKNDDEDRANEMNDEWKQVALVVDRLMFWLFMFITLFSTLVVLVIVPAVKYAEDEGK